MAQNCKCPACNPINQPNFEYVAPRKLTLKERIHKQRMENFSASDRAFEYVQANQGRYAEHRASILTERKMAKTGYLDAIGESVIDAAHYVGGITKAVGDTVTSSVESVLKNPSVIADTVNNVASTIVDGVTYFPDVVLDEVAPDLSYGAKDRTNKRIDSALAGISEGLDQLGEDFTQHNKAFSSGDFESAGAVVGGYVSSAVLPSKKIKALGGSSIDIDKPRGDDGRYVSTGEPKPLLSRPSLRSATKRKIEDSAEKDAFGNFVDDNDNIISDWHYGHKAGVENRRILKAADEMGMSQGELNDFTNSRPDYYQIEDAKTNLSHADEKLGSGDLDEIIEHMDAFLEKR
jgi:hypothetical protein